MTPAELLALADAATPGPWEWLDKFVWGFEGPKIERLSEAKISASDARLITLAPDLARLCAEMGEALMESYEFITFRAYWDPPDAPRAAQSRARSEDVLAKLSELEVRT